MAEVDLVAERRERTGKKGAREIRDSEMVPGVYYAVGEDVLTIKVNEKNLRQTIASGRVIVNLDLGGKTIRKCIIKELQVDPVTEAMLHVDLMGIQMDKEIEVALPIHLEGIPVGVRITGGVVQQVLREIILKALPGDIPDDISLNIEELDIGDSIHVSGIGVPNAEIMTDEEITIVTVVPPTVIVEPIVEEELEEIEGEEIEGEVAEGEETPTEKKAEGEDSKESKE